MKAIDKDAFSYSLQSDSLMDHRIVFSKEKKDKKIQKSPVAKLTLFVLKIRLVFRWKKRKMWPLKKKLNIYRKISLCVNKRSTH